MLILAILLVHTVYFPVHSLASTKIHNKQQDADEEENIETIIIGDEEEVIPLYESLENDSEILITLLNDDKVKLLETYEKYSLIEVKIKESEREKSQASSDEELEIWQGFIDNENIELDKENNHKKDNSSSDANSEDPDSNKNTDDNDSGKNNETNSDNDNSNNEDTDSDEETNSGANKEEDKESNEADERDEDKTKEENEKDSKETDKSDDDVVKSKEEQTDENNESNTDKSNNNDKEMKIATFSSSQNQKGVAKKSPTNVRAKTSTKSKVIKQFPVGEVIEYQDHSKNWNKITVDAAGKEEIGYIHKKHVTNVKTKPESLKGVAKKSPTNIRAGASTKSKVLKKLPIGSVENYETFSKNWNKITVNVNGKKEIGYIHKKHVTNVKTKPKNTNAVTKKSPTNVRAGASTKSKVINKIDLGTVISVKTFSKNWYEITTKVNGENKKGYLHRKHIGTKAVKNTKYNISLNEALNIQTGNKSTVQGSKNMYVSREALKKNKNGKWVITGKNWDVKNEPKSSAKTLGLIDERYAQGTIKVDSINSTKKYYKFEVQSIIANKNDVKQALNPNNISKNTDDYYQFLVLSQPAGTKAKDVNKNILNGKGILDGEAKSFIKAGKKHNINELYLISHAVLETGHGTSKLAKGIKVGLNAKGKPKLVTDKNKSKLSNKKKVYNMYGIGAVNAAAEKDGAIRAYEEGWTSPEKAIIGGAKFIGKNYIHNGQNTLYKMRWHPQGMVDLGQNSWHQYATDIGWASKQTSNLLNYYKNLDDYTLSFDVPSYK